MSSSNKPEKAILNKLTVSLSYSIFPHKKNEHNIAQHFATTGDSGPVATRRMSTPSASSLSISSMTRLSS